MKCTKTLVLALLAVFVTQAAFAQKGTEEQLIKEANTYFNSGQYLKAFPLYSQLVSLNPSNPDYNYKFGACAIYSEQDKTKAVKYLTIATSKGIEDKMAWYYLGKAYHLNYQFKDAIKAYEAFIRQADPKIVAKTDAQREVETCIYGSNLLANIKDISVISKTEADKANFFRYFNLEAIGGKILTVPEELKTKLDQKSADPGVIHYPGNSTTIYFSSYGKDGSNGKDIYRSTILPDGKFSTPIRLEGDVNTKYDEDYCFMHSDGKTLYFASKGHNSMGGYDIFKSECDPKTMKFGPAINLDFAINTPDDDILYIADSLNKKAYFASGRASDMSHLNVYNVMVESTPLQVVYIKGTFVSQINPDQHKAGIKIYETASNRMVCDGISGGQNGNYLMYVPKSGEYNFKVVTENSPQVHDVKVPVPHFDRPVALRQEMKLVSENGLDKLIVTNYFETPLEEDLSTLAAEMLRKKSNLDVNTDDVAMTASVNSSGGNTSGGELTTFEKTIENAPIAAGFANGTTVAFVIEGMQKEAQEINRFVSESDQKYSNSLAFASKKYKEANDALTEAETIRQSLGNVSSEDDIKKLRRSVELTDKAEALQIEAKAAMNSAESIQQYKVSEKERADQLIAAVTELSAADKAANYDQAVTIMTTEKDRQTALRDGNGNTPVAELQSKAKARESERTREEKKLENLRETEKEQVAAVAAAEAKKNAAKKEKERQAAANELATAQSELDNTRKSIAQQVARLEKSGFESKMAQANVNYFMAVSEDTNYGLQTAEMVKLSDTDKTKLNMRLDEMRNRVNALELTDPQMLALVTDNSTNSFGENNSGTTASAGSKPVNNTGGTAANQGNGSSMQATPISNNTNTAANINLASSQDASRGNNDVESIRRHREMSMALAGNTPELAPARRMILAESMMQIDSNIRILESKKQSGNFTEADNVQLGQFQTLRNETRAAMMDQTNATIPITQQEVAATYASVDPTYASTIQSYEGSTDSKLSGTLKEMEYKKQTLEKLKNARLTNAHSAKGAKDQAQMLQYGKTDAQYEAAINSLSNEVGDMNQLKSAYETENKAIIESDAVYAEKLENQVEVSETYLEALKKMETEKQQQLMLASTPEERASISAQSDEIKKESDATFKKLESYRREIQNAPVATEPKAGQPANASGKTLEDVMEEAVAENGSIADASSDSGSIDDGSTSERGNESGAENSESTTVTEDVKVVEKMFKKQEEAESIFAYESGAFEEIVAQHQTAETQLKNRDKIRELNDNIFLIEAEMENEKSPAKLRKLDYKAEQVYLKRSLIEIDNAKSIEVMTKQEYDEELKKAKEAMEANAEKIDSRIMIREEIKRLKGDATVQMQNAEEFRQKAPPILDDIEKADYYRQAFAKEAVAIDNLKRIQQICDNIDMLLKYSETDLAQLRSGKIPDDKMVTAMQTGETVSTYEDAATPGTSTEGDVATSESGSASGTEKSANGSDLNGTEKSATGEDNTVDMAKSADGSENQVMNFSTTENGEIVTDSKTVTADPNSVVNLTMRVGEAGNGTGTSTSTLKSTSGEDEYPTNDGQPAGTVANNGSPKSATSSGNDNGSGGSVGSANGNSNATGSATTNLNNNSGTNGTSTNTMTGSGTSLSNNTSGNTSTSTGSGNRPANATASGGGSSANAEDYYYSMPDVLVADLFKRTTRGVYSESKPIPVDLPMPKGVYYKVQIGAFRNDIPQNLYEEFAPICGESLKNGITRYTAGFFMTFENADQIKKEIRGIGYSDAFVVAYRDGKRIPLYEAMGKTDGEDFVAAVEKEYIYGDKGEAPVKKATPSSTAGTSGSTSNKGTIPAVENTTLPVVNDYYKGTANAVKATQVETVKGLFFTVQVGVYSKPVAAKNMYNIADLNSELTDSKKIRYTAGRFTSLVGAVNKRTEAKNLGISDAFITAYYNGRKITLSEADMLLKEHGDSILAK